MIQYLSPIRMMREIGMEPDAWQREVLMSASKNKMLVCGRQTGKSTIIAVAALHTVLVRDNVDVVILGPGKLQAQNLFRTVRSMMYSVGVTDTPYLTLTSMELSNGSRIICLPHNPDRIRGYTTVLLILEEAARVSEDVFSASQGFLATTQGTTIALSTPAGVYGWVSRAWEGKDGIDWAKWHVKASMCERISPEWLAQQKQLIGELMYNQEYEAEFIDPPNKVFRADTIDNAFDSGHEEDGWDLLP